MICANGLREGPAGHRGDPYCTVRVHSSRGTDEVFTEVSPNETNPSWAGALTLDVWEPDSRLEIVFWGWSLRADHALGTVRLPLGGQSRRGEFRSELQRHHAQRHGHGRSHFGSVYLRYDYKAPEESLRECVLKQVACATTPTFGKVIIRDLRASNPSLLAGAQGSVLAPSPFLQFTLTGSMGYQTRETKICEHTDCGRWNEFIVFDIYQRCGLVDVDVGVAALGLGLWLGVELRLGLWPRLSLGLGLGLAIGLGAASPEVVTLRVCGRVVMLSPPPPRIVTTLE